MSPDDDAHALDTRMHELDALVAALEKKRDTLKNVSEAQQARLHELTLQRDQPAHIHQGAVITLERQQHHYNQLKDQRQELSHELQIQVDERRRAQSKVVQLEMELNDLVEKHESLEHKFDLLNARQSSVKCRLCGIHSVEFALLPCFHFCYCQRCAEGLETCLVCRLPKQGIQKIYYG